MKMMRFWPVVLLTLCGCMVQTSKQVLMDSMREYNSGMRWGRTEWMAEYVPPKERDRLVELRQGREDVQITDCEIAAVKLSGKKRAVATVLIEWYLLQQGRVHKTYVEQTWIQRESGWQVSQQRIIKGAPFPLL